MNSENKSVPAKRRRGRPVTKGKSYDSVSTVRFRPDELEMLEILSQEADASKSEVIRNALRTYFYMKKNPDFFRIT